MGRQLTAFLLAVLLLLSAAFADMQWKQDTEGQKQLKIYTEQVNRLLAEAGVTPVNSLFEIYPGFAVMGITQEPDADTPEGVEITFQISADTILSLELRVNDLNLFPVISACFLRALYGNGMTQEDAIRIPEQRVKEARSAPEHTIEETVDDLNGTMPRIYFAYYPNQYHDNVSWMQMTLIFPMAGMWDGVGFILGEEKTEDTTDFDPEGDGDPDYEGYFSQDEYEHLEIFVTPTPEPESAAAEYDFR